MLVRRVSGINLAAHWSQWYHNKCQDPHQHQGDRYYDNGRHHCIIAVVGAHDLAQAGSYPARGATHIDGGGLAKACLQVPELQVALGLVFLLLFLELGQGEAGRGRLVECRGFLQDELALTALKAHGQSPLHFWGQPAENVLVVVQLRQVPAVGQLGQPPADGAGQGLQLDGRHVDAGQALQAERVSAGQNLRGLEDVVVRAEAHDALRVLFAVVTAPVPRDPRHSAFLAPSTLPPLCSVPLHPASVPLTQACIAAPASTDGPILPLGLRYFVLLCHLGAVASSDVLAPFRIIHNEENSVEEAKMQTCRVTALVTIGYPRESLA